GAAAGPGAAPGRAQPAGGGRDGPGARGRRGPSPPGQGPARQALTDRLGFRDDMPSGGPDHVLHVTGGRPLRGRVRIGGSKNATLPVMAASMLTVEPLELTNTAGVADTALMCEILGGLGVRGARVVLDMPTVTGTENIVMAAVLAEGRTEIFNAAREPHVQDLCRCLCAMGARIDGAGKDEIVVQGVERLGGARHRVIPDYLEA